MLHPETAQQIIDTWAKKPLDFEPGTQWQYSNTNFVIAGAIVEKVSGEKLMDFLGEHIFHPLGMKSVWNSDETKLTQTDATAILSPRPRPACAWLPKKAAAGCSPPASLAMTAHDLALWDESLIAQTVLKPESYKEMFTEVKLKDGKGTHYGLGVEVPISTVIATSNTRARSPASSPTTTCSSMTVPPLPCSPIRTPSAPHPPSPAWPLPSSPASRAAERKKQALAIYHGLQKGTHRSHSPRSQPQRLLHARGPRRLPSAASRPSANRSPFDQTGESNSAAA